MDGNRRWAKEQNLPTLAGHKQGVETLRELVRFGGERVFREREGLDYTVPDGFAGSILNLEPGTEYELEIQAIEDGRFDDLPGP